jgi:hypothetical protein
MTDVWLFFDPADGRRDSHQQRVQRVCEDKGWSYQPRAVRARRARQGRPIRLLESDLAAGLYPRLHRAKVAVLTVGAAPRVPLHPQVDEAMRRSLHVPLKEYVEYKAFWCPLPDDPDNRSWVGAFSHWIDFIDCEGEHDPRCLPFHIFRGDGRELHLPQRREEFEARYGAGSLRTDERSAEWRMSPKDFHALQESDRLAVAGYTLRAGCHWDLSATEYRISTPKGVWQVDGHANVYPDAHVRGPRKLS